MMAGVWEADPRMVERFNRLSKRYDDHTRRIPGYRRLVEEIVRLTEPRSSDIVVDIGTGPGVLCLLLAPFVKKAIGVDVSERMLEEARRRALKDNVENVEFRLGSFLNPGVDEKVDKIVTNLALHHLVDEDKRKAMNVMFNMLKDGGRVVIGDFMFFFNPEREPRKLKQVLDYVTSKLMVREPGESVEDFLSRLAETEHPSTASSIKLFLESAGFNVVAVKEVTPPALGVICAKKP